MNTKAVSRTSVFILSLGVWLLITSVTDRQELAAGVAVALLVALLTGDLLISGKIRWGLGKAGRLIAYLLMLVWEIFKANLHVAYVVLHPRLPIRPGIVKVRTALTSDAALTMLANSITLTPGTMTVDIDKKHGYLYIHWITALDGDVEENTDRISRRFENRLREIFQ